MVDELAHIRLAASTSLEPHCCAADFAGANQVSPSFPWRVLIRQSAIPGRAGQSTTIRMLLGVRMAARSKLEALPTLS